MRLYNLLCLYIGQLHFLWSHHSCPNALVTSNMVSTQPNATGVAVYTSSLVAKKSKICGKINVLLRHFVMELPWIDELGGDSVCGSGGILVMFGSSMKTWLHKNYCDIFRCAIALSVGWWVKLELKIKKKCLKSLKLISSVIHVTCSFILSYHIQLVWIWWSLG